MAIAVPHLLGGTYVAEMVVFGHPGSDGSALKGPYMGDYNMLMATTSQEARL